MIVDETYPYFSTTVLKFD